ncbi:MAG TPA: quinone oxidoreductase [Thermoanaerobaculia bacterium]|jgi:NADPH2:quinone reductase
MKALCFDSFGGPEVLALREIPDPRPRPGELLVRMRAIGLNFADVYRRRGNYHLAGQPPYILGYEGAGVVEEVAPEAETGRPSAWRAGDRVAFADVPFANAELVVVPADRAIPLPPSIPFDTAAALLLQGLTAHYLTHDSYAVRPGTLALVHAAAGGVGQLLTQIARLRGARVFGLTSSEPKRQAALAAGADEVALYASDWKAQAAAFAAASGRSPGLDVAYDSVGSTLSDSFAVVRNGGTVVFYGMAGGDPKPVDPRMLMDTSKTLTGGDLWNVLTSAEERRRRASVLWEWVESGALRPGPIRRFPLAEGADAHRLLESRESVGKILLMPG